jgi:hypothetical protein
VVREHEDQRRPSDIVGFWGDWRRRMGGWEKKMATVPETNEREWKRKKIRERLWGRVQRR